MKNNIGLDIFNLLKTYNYTCKHLLHSRDLPNAFLELEKKGYKQSLPFRGKFETPLITLTPPNMSDTKKIRFNMTNPVIINFVNEENDKKNELILKFSSFNQLINKITYSTNNKNIDLSIEELTKFIFNDGNSNEKEIFNLLHDINIDLEEQLAEFKNPIKNLLMMSIGRPLQKKLRNKM